MALACDLGADVACRSHADVADTTDGRGADLVGRRNGLLARFRARAARSARIGGRVVIVGIPENNRYILSGAGAFEQPVARRDGIIKAVIHAHLVIVACLPPVTGRRFQGVNSLFASRAPVGSKKYHDWPSNVVAWVHFVTYPDAQARADIKKIGRLGTRSLQMPACDREEGHGAGS